jgi:hypothetical protein
METTRDLASEGWSEYFDAVSKELLNAPVSIKVDDRAGPPSVKATRRALHALAYDQANDVFEVAVALNGPHPPRVLRHRVGHPERITVDNRTMLAPMTIAVDGSDGVRTLIRIAREPTG